MLLAAVLLAACAGTPTGAPPSPAGQGSPVRLPAGFRAEVYARGLRGPTALAWGPDGALYLTQLNGGEADATGQVVVVAHPGATPAVVVDALDKPTGLAWRDDRLFVAAGRAILEVTRAGDGRAATRETVVAKLPFNGRSEGQIDVLPDGRLLFEASGTVNDRQSGTLLTLVPGEQPQVLARGLKGAYAHAVDPRSGAVYSTDIHDEAVNGQPPADEINLVQMGADYGWPRCNGDRVPATNFGGSAQGCVSTRPSLLSLPPGSTPTGLAWYDGTDFPRAYRDVLYVALWNGQPPQVQRVRVGTRDGQAVGAASTFLTGLERPIDVLPDPRGGLLVVDFGTGVVYHVTRAP